MDPVIKVEELSKQYRIGAARASYTTLRESLMAKLRAPFDRVRFDQQLTETSIWALKDVSFEVLPGEIVGIIGRNAAGKSTLLKILSRITEPTRGRARIRGRVGSLLEVGTGFHPELTGRENIFLNGAVIGMNRREIARKFDEIVAFAEIDRFLDTSVKFYSSGMYMRLAFAVAAHLEPEILLVDEVLAVGDAQFQAKCLGKIGAVANEGRTVLFVSHNMAAVQALCQRVFWFQEGEIIETGQTEKVVKSYLSAACSAAETERVWNDPASAPGNNKVRLHSVRIRPLDGSSSNDITIQTSLGLEFEFWNLEPGARLSLSLHVYNQQGITVFVTAPIREPAWLGKPLPVGLFRSECHIPGDLLNDGIYRVRLLVLKDQEFVVYSHDDALVFEVNDAVERRNAWFGKWEGAVRPDLEWKTEQLSQSVATTI
jgi:lipopolysaccharide transport system ATP-binding protein